MQSNGTEMLFWFFSPSNISNFEVHITASLASCSSMLNTTFASSPQTLPPIGNMFVSLANANHFLAAAQGTSAGEGIWAVEGRSAGLISDVWIGTCQEVGSYRKFCFFYIIYILFMKPKCFGPISLTKVPSVPTQATVQALVSELENPSRPSVSVFHSKGLSRKAHGNLPSL